MLKKSLEAQDPTSRPDVTALRPKLADASHPAPPTQTRRSGRSRQRLLRWGLIGLGPILVLLVAGWFYVTGGRYVSTDDAFVKTDLVTINAQVAGQVVAVHVANNQRVQDGDLLFELDPASYQIALNQAEADLANVASQVAALRASYMEKSASLRNAEDQIQYQQREFNRQTNLRSSGVSSEQKVDEARRALDNALRQADVVRQQIAAIQAQLGGDVNKPTEEMALYRAALARRNDAALALATTPASRCSAWPRSITPGSMPTSRRRISRMWWPDSRRPSPWTPIPGSRGQRKSKASAQPVATSFRCCRRRTHRATGSKSSSAFPYGSRSSLSRTRRSYAPA